MMNISIEPWYVINDNVMGELSSGGIAPSDEGLHFNGTLFGQRSIIVSRNERIPVLWHPGGFLFCVAEEAMAGHSL